MDFATPLSYCTDDTSTKNPSHHQPASKTSREGWDYIMMAWTNGHSHSRYHCSRNDDLIHPHHVSPPELRTTNRNPTSPQLPSRWKPNACVRQYARIHPYPSMDASTPVDDGCAFGFCNCRVVDTTATGCNVNIDHICENKQTPIVWRVHACDKSSTELATRWVIMMLSLLVCVCRFPCNNRPKLVQSDTVQFQVLLTKGKLENGQPSRLRCYYY